jgi:hypothetical protein
MNDSNSKPQDEQSKTFEFAGRIYTTDAPRVGGVITYPDGNPPWRGVIVGYYAPKEWWLIIAWRRPDAFHFEHNEDGDLIVKGMNVLHKRMHMIESFILDPIDKLIYEEPTTGWEWLIETVLRLETE